MTEYDPKIIKEYAEVLYAQAKAAVSLHFFIGIFLGFFLFNAISILLIGTIDFLISAIGVMVGGVLGYGTGKSRASELKLKAQLALCQMRIEENSSK